MGLVDPKGQGPHHNKPFALRQPNHVKGYKSSFDLMPVRH